MTEDQAEDIWITAMVKAHGGQATTSKRFFKAIRVLNMRDAIKLYESLSEEFVRKGIASNRFSELEQLFKIAEVSLTDYEDKEKELTTANKRISSLNARLEVLEEALKELGHYGIDFGYGKYDCDVAKVAQQALAKSKDLANDK